MPISSNWPDVQLQVLDIFTFLFERKDRPYPDNHGMYYCTVAHGHHEPVVTASSSY